MAVTEDGVTAKSDSPLSGRLASNALVQVVGSALSSAVSFFTFVAVTRALGPSSFGDYTASIALIAVLVILADLGLNQAVVREISATPERTSAMMQTSLPLRAILAGTVALVLVIFSLFAPLSEGLRNALLIGSLGAVATMLTFALTPVLQARLMMHWVALANVVGRLVTLGLSLGALALGAGFIGVVWANVLGLAATLFVTLAVVSRMVSLRPVLDVSGWTALARGSIGLGLAFGTQQVYSRIGTLMLALLSTGSAVGLYGAAYKFVELSALLMTAITVTTLPALSRFVATNDTRLHDLIQKTFEGMLSAALPLTLVLFLYAREIVQLSSGAQYADAGQALRILAAWVPLMFISSIVWNMLIASRRERILVALSVGLVTVNVLLSLILIPRFGYEGAAYAVVGSEALGFLVGGTLMCRMQRFRPSLRYLGVLVPALAGMAAVIVFLPGPWFLTAGIAAAVYSAIVLAVPGTIRDVATRLLRGRRPAAADS